jgi:Spy/CpxP family protein refolding chaperone
MNRDLHWKLVAGFLLVFIAGGVTGAFFAVAQARRHFLFASPDHGMVAERMRERLRAELKLTPEQVARISPIIDQAGAQLEQIRIETGRRVYETFAEAHRQMSATLTDEQRVKLQRLQQRHRRWLHHFPGRESAPPELPPP